MRTSNTIKSQRNHVRSSLFLAIGTSMLLGSVLADRAPSVYPYSHPCLNDPMYYEDSAYVLKDLQAGKFSRLYINYHSCTWSPSETVRKNQAKNRNQNYYANRELEGSPQRRLEDLRSYQCGVNKGEEQWQANFSPCFNANAAYTLYGVLAGSNDEGCSKSTYINTFFTRDGLYSFLTALQLNGQDFNSYYDWNNVDDTYYIYYNNDDGGNDQDGDDDGAQNDYGYNNEQQKYYDNDKNNYYEQAQQDDAVDANQDDANEYYQADNQDQDQQQQVDNYYNGNQNAQDEDNQGNDEDNQGNDDQDQQQQANNYYNGNQNAQDQQQQANNYYNNNAQDQQQQANNYYNGNQNAQDQQQQANNYYNGNQNAQDQQQQANNYYNGNDNAQDQQQQANNYYNDNAQDQQQQANNYYNDNAQDQQQQANNYYNGNGNDADQGNDGQDQQQQQDGNDGQDNQGRRLAAKAKRTRSLQEDEEGTVFYANQFCRNKVKNGYSMGIGCTAPNNQGKSKFTIDKFSGYYCLGENYYKTLNTLDSLNEAIQDQGQCIEIYNAASGLNNANYLLEHSKACSPTIYGTSICPDPYRKIVNCEEKLYWAERGLSNMATTDQVKRRVALSVFFIFLTIVFIFLGWNELLKEPNRKSKVELVDASEFRRKGRFDDDDDDITVNSMAPPSGLRKTMSEISTMKKDRVDFDDWNAAALAANSSILTEATGELPYYDQYSTNTHVRHPPPHPIIIKDVDYVLS